MQYEVACLDITPLSESAESSRFVAVGLWTEISTFILSLPHLNELYYHKLGGGMLIILQKFKIDIQDINKTYFLYV